MCKTQAKQRSKKKIKNEEFEKCTGTRFKSKKRPRRFEPKKNQRMGGKGKILTENLANNHPGKSKVKVLYG